MIPRSLAALAVTLLALFALHRLVWRPHQCNVVRQQVGASLERVWDQRHTAVAFDTGVRNEPILAKAVEHCPHDVALLMLAGSNQLLMNRHDRALAMFERALQYDQRPELLLAAGIAQLQLGRREEAIRNFVTASSFGGFSVLVDVPDAEARLEAYRIVGKRREEVLALRGELDTRNLLQNSRFEPAERRTTQTDRPGESPSAARTWSVVNEGGTVSTNVVPSQKRPGGTALHVVTTGERSGVRQVWAAKNERPRAQTTALIYVNRGRVCIGSGSGPPIQNACTSGTGRWERLEGVSESCPAETTVISTASADGADFIVDEITARLALGIPCEP
jgi:tetratricopeptide (TPR) repeat protein